MNTPEEKTNLVLLTSKKLNDSKVFEQYKDSIDKIIKNFDTQQYMFTIGRINNESLIKYIQELGYEVIVKSQYPTSVKNSNKKIIRESHGAIFFILNESSIMMELLEYAYSCNLAVVVPIHFRDNTTNKLQNATYLFRNNDIFSHSESRWNGIMQLASIWMGKHHRKLNTYKSTYESKNNPKEWLHKDGVLSFDGWNAHNTVVEGRLNNSFFGIDNWSVDFDNLSPDITHINNDTKKIVFIEIKTIGSSVKQNIKLYRRMVDALNNSDKWQCELYYLLSYGHEEISDWKILNHNKESVLLWEELFSSILESDLKQYLDENLSQYTLMPNWLDS
jgi:hypothetical protein